MTNSTRRRWGVSVTPQPLFTPGKNPVPIVQEAGRAPGLVWTGAENLASTGIQSPGRPGRSQSLHRPCHPAHKKQERNRKNNKIINCMPWKILHLKIFQFESNYKGGNKVSVNIRISRRVISHLLRVSRYTRNKARSNSLICSQKQGI